jgi:ATP-binding cassette, subfamily B, bacterial CvaB/MchF/RaxB
VTLAQLFGRLRGVGGAFAQAFLLSGALEVFAIVAPLFMQMVVDHAVVAADRDLLVVLGVGFLLLALVKTAVTAARSWVVLYIGTNLNLHLVTRPFSHLLRLPTSFFERRYLGDVISRFESLNAMQRILTTSFIEAIVDGVMVIITLAMMYVYSWKLASIVCAAGALYALLRAALVRPLRQASEEQILRGAKQQSNFLETVRGAQSVKLFGRESTRRALYQNLAVDHFNAGVRVQKLSIWFHALNGALFGIENVSVVWLGATLVLDGGLLDRNAVRVCRV